MNTVGADGRTQYYRLTPAEVMAALHGHKMGLTNVEAKRRVGQSGANIFTLPENIPARGQIWQRALQASSLLAVAAAALAFASRHPAIGVVLLSAGLAYTAAAYTARRQLHLPLSDATAHLPTRAKVLRNGQITVIATHELAPGDIIRLEIDDVVPADVRLATVANLVIDERILTGNHSHAHKYTHALGAHVPVFARHNLAYAGTKVISGEGFGIVIGTGNQTELDRSLQLASQAPPEAPFERPLLGLTRTTAAIGALSGLVILGFGLASGYPLARLTDPVLTLLVTVLPAGILLATAFIVLHVQWLLGLAGIHIKSLYAIDRLDSLDMLLFDPEAFSTGEAMVSRARIGHTLYGITGDGHAPTGTFTANSGKRLTRKELRELSLFFEAATLSHHTTVLAHATRNAAWRIHGNHHEGALLTMARKAGLQTERLRDLHETPISFPYDHHRHMASSVRIYGDDRVLFVYGHPDEVLAQSSKLWDHGHIRAISETDRKQFTHHHTLASAEGAQTVALAYRILPKRTSVQTLAVDKAEQKLTLLGFVDITPASHTHVLAVLRQAKQAGVRVTLLSPDPRPYSISSEDLRTMTDAQILSRLKKGTATFAGLCAEDKLRIIQLAQRAKHRIGITGLGMADVPALLQANAGLVAPSAPALLRAAASVITARPETIFLAGRLSTNTMAKLKNALRAIITATVAIICLALMSSFGMLVWHLPQVALPARVTVLVFVLFPVIALTASHQPNAKHSSKLEQQYAQRVMVWIGIAAGGLAYASFLAWFAIQNIDPRYVTTASILSTHAGAVAYIVIVLCQIVSAIVALAKTKLSTLTLMSLLISFALLVLPILLPVTQRAFSLSNPGFAGWALAACTSIAYLGLLVFEIHTRKHARHAIIMLHQGKNIPRRASARF